MTERGLPKPFAILVSVLLALYFVPLGALPASAAHVPAFEIDGNLQDDNDGGIDWETLLDTNNEGLLVVNDNEESGEGDPGDTTVFATSSKENDVVAGENTPDQWSPGSPNTAPGKTDIGNYYKYVRLGEDDHIELFFAWDRLSPSGTDYYYLELNKLENTTTGTPGTDSYFSVPNRSEGDVRFTIHETGNQELVLIAIHEWDGEQWVSQPITPGGFIGAVNAVDIDPAGFSSPAIATSGNPQSRGKIPSDQFFEVEFDLTTLLGLSPDCPPAFGTLNFRSSTGEASSETGENLKDYIEPMQLDAPSTCGSLTIFKEDEDGEPLGGAIFEIDPNPLPDGVTGADLDVLIIFDDSDDNTDIELTPDVGFDTNYDDPTDADGEITLDEIEPGTYTVRELVAPDGYIATDDDETLVVPSEGNEEERFDSVTFVNTLGSVKFFKTYESSGDLPVDGGALFRIYRETDGIAGFTSDDENFTVKDDINNVESSGGDVDDANNATGTIKVVDLVVGEYLLKEISAPTGWLGDALEVTFSIPDDVDGADVVLDSDGTGDTTDEIFDNALEPHELTIVKRAEDDDALVDGAVFELYRETGGESGLQIIGETAADESEGTCTTGESDGDVTTTDTGRCTIDGLAWGETYYWYEVSVPAPFNLPSDRVIGPITINADGSTTPAGQRSVTMLDPESAIRTEASDGSQPDATIRDLAFVTGVNADNDGIVTFYLYGSFGTSDVTSSSCAYELDGDGNPIYDSGENFVDSFAVSAPSAPNAQDEWVYDTGDVAVPESGNYAWIAVYEGDENGNRPVAGVCGDLTEISEVDARPDIVTDAGDDRIIGQNGTVLTDSATLSNGTEAPEAIQGTITFKLYYSADGSLVGDTEFCSTQDPIEIIEVPVNGNGTYSSDDAGEIVTVHATGSYTWTAQYTPVVADGPADENNLASDVHGCGLNSETVEVTPRQPTITTEVPAQIITLGPDGSDLTDKATLANGTVTPKVSGTITFTLYGPFTTAPGANSCTSDKVYDDAANKNPNTATVTNGNGDYFSEAVHVSSAGYYTWRATYNGDANNEAATHACGLASETVQVLPRQPVVSTQISATSLVIAGQGSVSFSDQATLSEATNTAAGTITFRLFGPGATVAAACATTGAVQGAPVAVSGNGTYQGPTVSVSTPGFYSWVATYSGDANNLAASHACGLPSETVQVFSGSNPTLTKVADPPSGSIVQRGDTVTYTVTVGNTGDVAIDDGVVRDTLPAYVTVDQASVTASGGTFTAGGDRTVSAGTITWTVDLAPGATRSFTYKVTIGQDAPELATLVNLVEFLGLRATTTHRVPEGDIAVVKEVSPIAGSGVVVEFGDTLTYTLTVTASGQQDQTNVVVTDYVPGFDPARTASGKTTYVVGSAACVGVGTCTVTEPGADGLITWSLGSMAAGSTRQVTFQVTIDDVVGEPGEAVAVDILNAGAVRSTESGTKPSNEVVTPVTAVFGIKLENPPPPEEPAVLPRTGSVVPVGPLAGTGLTLLGLGLLLVATTRRRGAHRRG